MKEIDKGVLLVFGEFRELDIFSVSFFFEFYNSKREVKWVSV